MARITEISKVSVRVTQPGQYSITLNLRYKEDAEVLLDQNFSEDRGEGQPIDAIEKRFIESMQRAIDNYKKEETVMNHPQLETSITSIQNTLEV